MAELTDILSFAYKLGFENLYDWQCKILLRYQSGDPTAAAAMRHYSSFIQF
jgi:hypothetical protein